MEILLICLVAGFVAQMIDGSLGMGYGIILSILLFSMGVPPISVSASVHVAKFFAAALSGYSHFKFGNVDKGITTRLAVGGILGAIVGTYVLTNAPTQLIKPTVAVYLTLMGMVIVYKAFHRTANPIPRETESHTLPLGMAGGFCDAIGGGGWGAIVTSGLLVRGKNPRLVIGSVSLAEFFVAMVIAGLLLAEVPEVMTQVQIIVGLVLGSALAAPLAAYVCGMVSPRPLMFAVGGLIITLSLSTVVSSVL